MSKVMLCRFYIPGPECVGFCMICGADLKIYFKGNPFFSFFGGEGGGGVMYYVPLYKYDMIYDLLINRKK